MASQYITSIPEPEFINFEKILKKHRKNLIPSAESLVNAVISGDEHYKNLILNHQVSKAIAEIRQAVWDKFLIAEAPFNATVMKEVGNVLPTMRNTIDDLINDYPLNQDSDDLREKINTICGEYTARTYPYVYALSLSNTNSRRSRSGKTFEKIIYEIYNILGYTFDSQSKAGKDVFSSLGLGKLVDSVLPGLESFQQRRDKVIIGTMKTSLRERWQEVAEEIERTGIPKIHLLTVDEDISKTKAQQMGQHNIIVVTYDHVANSDKLAGFGNVISFEEYFFNELPEIFTYWSNSGRSKSLV